MNDSIHCRINRYRSYHNRLKIIIASDLASTLISALILISKTASAMISMTIISLSPFHINSLRNYALNNASTFHVCYHLPFSDAIITTTLQQKSLCTWDDRYIMHFRTFLKSFNFLGSTVPHVPYSFFQDWETLQCTSSTPIASVSSIFILAIIDTKRHRQTKKESAEKLSRNFSVCHVPSRSLPWRLIVSFGNVKKIQFFITVLWMEYHSAMNGFNHGTNSNSNQCHQHICPNCSHHTQKWQTYQEQDRRPGGDPIDCDTSLPPYAILQ